MTSKEADDLMRKRGFTLGARTGSGIRLYSYSDVDKTPGVLIEAIPERNEFRIKYMNIRSIAYIETPWCSPLSSKEQFKKVLIGVKRWARKVEELYDKEE